MDSGGSLCLDDSSLVVNVLRPYPLVQRSKSESRYGLQVLLLMIVAVEMIAPAGWVWPQLRVVPLKKHY